MLPKGAVLGAVAICVVAFYCKLWNIQLFRDEQLLLQQLQLQSQVQTSEPVIRFVGRSFFYISTAAWVVLSLQSFVVAIQRAMYKPKVSKALQPLDEDTRQQMLQEQAENDPSTCTRSDTCTPTGTTQGNSSLTQPTHLATAAAAPILRPPSRTRQQQQEHDWRHDKRMKALEAAQKALDEKAAAQRAIKDQEEAERHARKKQAAEAAARQKAEREAAQAAARAEAEARAAAAVAEVARRRALWDQAVREQWHGLPPPALPEGSPELGSPASDASAQSEAEAPGPASGSSASSQPSARAIHSGTQNQPVVAGAAAAVAAAAQDRHIRQQQDEEYLLSLERDKIKAAEKAMRRKAQVAALQQQGQQQHLAALRQSLQRTLTAEPPHNEQEVLAVRVRLPGGGHASRRFSVQQGLEDMFAWVYSLPEMPLWAPGSWTLISAFPRRRLAPPCGSTWAPGVWKSQQETTAQEILLPGEWMVQVSRLEDPALWVRTHQDTTVLELQRQIESQTGVAPGMQRLIFSGQILHHPHRSMKQLGITQGDVLQLAVRSSDTSTSSSAASADGASISGEAASADAHESSNPDGVGARAQELGKAAEHAYLGSGEELMVTTVAEVQEQVAAGAPLLALYVEALQ